MPTRGRPPMVTCVCPTYGRFEKLRMSISFFLLQDYPYKHMLILNDAPVPITSAFPFIEVINREEWIPTLGRKRQALLQLAKTAVLAHWDDDDVYLPWHLSQCVQEMQISGKSFVKPRRSLYMPGSGNDIRLRGPVANNFEGSIVFRRDRALAYGGYTQAASGQTLPMLTKAEKAGDYHKFDPYPGPSYIYRWGEGLFHISGGGNKEGSSERFRQRNCDFGEGKGDLTPKDVGTLSLTLEHAVHGAFPGWEKFVEGLEAWRKRPF